MGATQRLSRRTRVRHGQGITTVIIAPEGGIASAIVGILVLAFWTFGGLFAALMLMVELDNGNSGSFFMVWLTAWVAAEAFGVIFVLWKLFGRIVIRVSPKEVAVSHKILGLIGPTQRMPAETTTGMFWVPDDPMVTRKVNGRRIPQTALKIHAAPYPVIVARGISREDAEAVIAACSPRMPRWGRAAA